jgi:hypothetical protein
LILLADSLEDEPYAPGSPGVIDIASYGVTPNGATPSTAPIQKALDDLASRTDGVLYFGAGTYLTGSLRVGSHTTVYLAPGATLRGTGANADYPKDPELTDGIAGSQSAVPEVSQIEFDNAVGSRLIGRGIVDMNGTALRQAGSKGGRLLMVKNSQNIEVRDVLLRDPASWNTQILYSTDVTFSNVKVINHAGPAWNTDGIDPDSSQHVVIDDAFIYSGDDGFAVKSSGSYRGWVRESTDIVICNSTVSTLTAGLKIGTESLAKYTERVTYENDNVISAECAIRAIVRDGSIYRDNAWRAVRVEDIAANQAQSRSAPMQFLVEQRHATSVIGSIESGLLEGVEVSDPGENPSAFSGFNASHEISGISFIDLNIAGRPIDDLSSLDSSLNMFALSPTFTSKNDEPTLSILAVPQYATTSAPGGFEIARSLVGTSNLEIEFNVYGSATNGVDYKLIPTHTSITGGALSVAISIAPTREGPAQVKTVRTWPKPASRRHTHAPVMPFRPTTSAGDDLLW